MSIKKFRVICLSPPHVKVKANKTKQTNPHGYLLLGLLGLLGDVLQLLVEMIQNLK